MRKNTIIDNIVKDSNNQLYNNFVKHFYSYIPVDYLDVFTEAELALFCERSFEFAKKTEKLREVSFEQISKPDNFAIFHVLGKNKPFIVDSLKTLFAGFKLKYDFFIHPVMYLERNSKNELVQVSKESESESLVCIAIRGKITQDFANDVTNSITSTLEKVDVTIDSWGKILGSIDKAREEINTEPQTKDTKEAIDFLEWLKKDNFTFLGSVNFDLTNDSNLKTIGESNIWGGDAELLDVINNSKLKAYKAIVEFGKLTKVSPIHRDNFIDYILIKQFDSSGKLKSGYIFIGLYGSNLDYQSVKNIPIIREKLQLILEKANFSTHGYNSKKLKIIVESLPRVALFHIGNDELLELALQTLSAMSVRNLKLFRLGDCRQNFVELIIFLPRERFTPDAQQKIQDYLQDKFGIKILKTFVTEVSQNFVFLYSTFASDVCKDISKLPHEAFERDLELLTNFWQDSFNESCRDLYECDIANLYISKYYSSFPSDYQFNQSPEEAAKDVSFIQKLSKETPALFHLSKNENNEIYLKIFSSKGKLTLSDTMPLLENLGFLVKEEKAYTMMNDENICIHKYNLSTKNNFEDFDNVKALTESALCAIMASKTSTDHLSKLITYSKISWREVDLIRTLAFYMHQTNLTYDYKYVSENLIKHFEFTKNLIKLFDVKFNPKNHNETEINSLIVMLKEYLANVMSNTEDRVLRTMLSIIEASIRTNYYQTINGENKPYISIKFNSSKVPHLPQPVPYAEIFVYSNDFEAIHLRGGKVARGGLRWSDRGEDYRVEVLGLMKAQMTKNSVIVPVGSKGGFFVRFSSEGLSREEYTSKAINCYKNFLRGLLDLTDNIVDSKIINPKDTVIYDENDPYLVVAADKGTATFSDYANSVSHEYNFWLGDAFASGGSAGYDHKKMGITAKGGWISVQRHFKELGVDVQKDNITVTGIGDMAGDVFGNGLLLSESVKLVAAFNHMHIFVDPNPDPKTSFAERKRLFEMPGSKWSDYSPTLISKGGGVFDRKAKSIKLNKEIKSLLDIEQDEIIPDDLIRYILKANVDLLWNGGIGTYIKAASEENYTIGDKTNDNLRVNGSEVRAKVIGEGGNLGASQKGRIEYAKSGGKINTDFIDNSAGVDCSDHEVNIKIALGKAVSSGKLSIDSRNNFLAKMTNQVAELVLEDNKDQTLAITIMEHSPIFTVEAFSKLIDILEEEKLLQRSVEFIPTSAELIQRASNNEKLTRPELAVILSYSKRYIYSLIEHSKLPTDKYFDQVLLDYFPANMKANYASEIMQHQLRNEIILTEITNKLVNQLSGPVLSSLIRETGAELCDIVRGFYIVQEIFDLNSLWLEVEKLPSSIPLNVMIEIYTDINKVIRRGISWMIANLEHPLDITSSIATYKDDALKISDMITKNLMASAKEKFDTKYKKYTEAGIPKALAEKCSKLESLVSSFDIAFISKDSGAKPEEICRAYFVIGSNYNIDWLRKSCDRLMTESYWQRLSLQSLKDDLYDKQRRLIKMVISDKKLNNLEEWFAKNEKHSKIFNNFVDNLIKEENIDISMLILASKKLEMFIRKT